MAVYRYEGLAPEIHKDVFVSESSVVLGKVTIKAGSSVWYQAVIRGDSEDIKIGEGTNIQDGAVLHADPGFPLTVSDSVTVGHQAMLHGCTIESGCLIGIQAIVLNGAVIGRNSLVAAGALVKEGAVFPPESLIMGVPARFVRKLTDEDVAKLKRNAENYIKRSKSHQSTLERIR